MIHTKGQGSFLHYPKKAPRWQNAFMDIRERIESIIDSREDMTVRSVSLKAGLSDSMLNKFLKGRVQSLTLDTVDKVAAALEVDPRWLAYGEGDPEMASDLAALWRKIDKKDRERARLVLEAFARTGTEG